MIFFVWAGLCLILFGLGYALRSRLEMLANYAAVPLAIIVLCRGSERYWQYRSTIYATNYRNEVIVGLAYLVFFGIYRYSMKRRNAGD